jgi:peptidoglycan/LPS O-acetylase OafA/YrhL
MVFFVISGYWIARSVMRRLEFERWSWSDYMADRLVRLWIVLLPALLIGGTLDLVARDVFGSRVDNLAIENLLVSCFFLIDVFAKALGSNGPLWSLGAEFWYYVWFPLILVPIFQRRLSVVGTILLVVSLVVCFGHTVLFPCWLTGAGVYFATRDPSNAFALAIRDHRRLSWGLSVALLMGSIYIAHLYILSYFFGSLIVSLGFAALLVTFLVHDMGPPRWLAPLAGFGSKSSFSLYALHMPFVALTKVLIDPHDRLRANGLTFATAIALLAALIFIAIVFSMVTEHQTARVRSSVGRLLSNISYSRRTT